jgi:hypothetical protein
MSDKVSEEEIEPEEPDFEEEYDRLRDDSNGDLDDRLKQVFADIRKDYPASLFNDERRFWRSVMAKAEHELSNVDAIQAGPANMRHSSTTSSAD